MVLSAAHQISFAVIAYAQNEDESGSSSDGTVLTTEGISNDVDKKRRSPVVSASTQYSAKTNTAKILVDAYIPNEDYQKYPIKFDFYVNRSLYASQIRSTELPGPIGIDVGASTATVPFNFAIVATLLHPNREFTTVLNGAVFATNLTSTLPSCSLTFTAQGTAGASSSGTTTYVAEEVPASQVANSGVTVSFTSSRLEDGSSADEVHADASLTFSGGNVSGTLTTTINGRGQSVTVSGEGTTEDAGVTALDVKSGDGLTTFKCE